jgi:hypothetical protein
VLQRKVHAPLGCRQGNWAHEYKTIVQTDEEIEADMFVGNKHKE